MAKLYLAPWAWIEQEGGGYAWDRPGAIGRLDLRSYAGCAQPGVTPAPECKEVWVDWYTAARWWKALGKHCFEILKRERAEAEKEK